MGREEGKQRKNKEGKLIKRKGEVMSHEEKKAVYTRIGGLS